MNSRWCLPGPVSLLLALGLALSACEATQGEDNHFDPLETTNTDFAAARTTAVGNQPQYMDLRCTLTRECSSASDVLSQVLVVNGLANPALDAGGGFVPSASLVLLNNNRDGTFTQAKEITTEQFPSIGILRDLDGGGLSQLDVIVLDDLNLRLAIYRNDGSGLPDVPTQEFTFLFAAGHVGVGDLDGDGDLDIVVSVPQSTNLVTLINQGGTFTRRNTAAQFGLSRFVLADFNSDGLLDMAVLDFARSTVDFLRGDGAGGFTETGFVALNATPRDIAGGDLLGNGRVDIAVVSDYGARDENSALFIIGMDGSGGVATTELVLTTNFSYQMFLRDVLGTGAPLDVLTLHTNGLSVSLCKSPCRSPFSFSYLNTTRNTVDLAVGDINRTGGPDVVTAETVQRTLGVFAGDGAGNFTRTQVAFSTKVTFPRLVDVDADGVLDLLVLQPNDDKIAVLLNQN